MMRTISAAMSCLVLSLALQAPAQAHDPSAASELSVLPSAALIAGPAILLSGAAALSVVTVHATGASVVWVLERAVDGARFSVEMSAAAAGAASVVAGTVVASTVITAGVVLSVAGQAIAIIPNAIGESLLYSERLDRYGDAR